MMIQDVPGAGMILLSPVRQNVLSLDVPVAFYLLIVSRIDVIILILTLLFCLFFPPFDPEIQSGGGYGQCYLQNTHNKHKKYFLKHICFLYYEPSEKLCY